MLQSTKHRLKLLYQIISLVLSLALITGCTQVRPDIKVRTIDQVKPDNCIADRFKPFFESTETTYNAQKGTVSTTSIPKTPYNVDNLSFEETTEATSPTLSDIIMICTFDMQNMVYTYDEYSVNDTLHQTSLRHIETDAIITPSGGLDALIEIDGQEYRMSDYCDNGEVDHCAVLTILGIVGAIIASYVIVSEGAEQIKMDQNLDYNQGLETKGMGVSLGNYIYSQKERIRQGYRCADYHFGFTTFEGVGCEVAAAYNLNIQLNSAEMLSSVIYAFECSYIVFAVAWGNGGSDATQIYKYLKFKGYNYKEFLSYDKFKTEVNSRRSCHIIMARWNDEPLKNGYHTFYIRKVFYSDFYGYNWKYDIEPSNLYSIGDFNNGAGFIVGYVIWN